MHAPAGGPPGVRAQGRKGDDGSHKACPPPLQRDGCRASCLRRACVVPATCVQRREDDKAPPPHTPPPPEGWRMKEGRGGQRPPPPEDKAASWGGSGERMRDGPHDRGRRKHAPCKPHRGGHRGSERRVGRATTGATRHAPLPCRGTSAAPRACAVLATCLRRRKDSEGAPPPPTPFSHPPRKGARTARRRRGDMGGGQRTDRRARGRDGRRARPRGHGGPKRKTPPLPPPLQPRPMLASCLRHACDMRATKGR